MDATTIAREERERAAIGAMLAGIFVDTNAGEPVVAAVARPSWLRTEVDAIAARFGLSTDGALERTNDVAYEASDGLFATGDDPIEDAAALKGLAE